MSYDEMKDWPDELLDALALVYGMVERQGAWPALPPNVVCLLRKGGTLAVDDRRPVVLLACGYRLWPACRAQAPRSWLRSNNILVAGEACGPDVKAGELALRLAAARLLGGEVGGLALDWSKCYDRLP